MPTSRRQSCSILCRQDAGSALGFVESFILKGAVQPQRTQRTQREKDVPKTECAHLTNGMALSLNVPSLRSLRSLRLTNCCFQADSVLQLCRIGIAQSMQPRRAHCERVKTLNSKPLCDQLDAIEKIPATILERDLRKAVLLHVPMSIHILMQQDHCVSIENGALASSLRSNHRVAQRSGEQCGSHPAAHWRRRTKSSDLW